MMDIIYTPYIQHFILVLCRIAPIIALVPGIHNCPAKIKATTILVLTLAIAPSLPIIIPKNYLLSIISETFLGFTIGLMVYIFCSATHVAATIIAMQSGISAAALGDNSSEHGSNIAQFLTLMATTLFFSTDAYLFLLNGIANTYSSPGIEELGNYFLTNISNAFNNGIRIASPIMFLSLIIYIAMGITNRLIPNVHVFLVATPAHIWLSFSILAMSISGSILWHIDSIKEFMLNIFKL